MLNQESIQDMVDPVLDIPIELGKTLRQACPSGEHTWCSPEERQRAAFSCSQLVGSTSTFATWAMAAFALLEAAVEADGTGH